MYKYIYTSLTTLSNMDLTQRKLSKAEWASIEVPASADEMRIIGLIMAGYHDVHLRRNPTPTILQYLKIKPTDTIDAYIYSNYIRPHITTIVKKYNNDMDMPSDAVLASTELMSATSAVCTGLKKADLIRFSNADKQIQENKDAMFEFILLDLLMKMYKYKYKNKNKNKGTEKDEKKEKEGGAEKNWLFYYYTLQQLLGYSINLLNMKLVAIIKSCLEKALSEINMPELVALSVITIERNTYLLKYADETLYDHQKKLFTICKRSGPKLVLYIAPTGTGKTMSPIGLSERHRVIFVCAARHVGLALAKAAISAQKKVAFAFGCAAAEDIRLHYYAAEEYTQNKKSGGIGKVDNTVGNKVEIIISDIQSYLPAMYYMLAFNPKENIILYWDEPTITMDYAEHEFHSIIKKNWSDNLIPNVVLSSATLPQRDELADTIQDFREQFSQDGSTEVEINEIISHDCKKTIPIINKEGFIEMPHYLHADYKSILEVVAHCQKYPTLLRYLDLGEAVKFIMYIYEHDDEYEVPYIRAERYSLENNFVNPVSITMEFIKTYYLDLLGNLKPFAWPLIYKEIGETRLKKQESNINIVGADAHTLTDGPTIFLADDVSKVAQFYIQAAGIPENVSRDINTTINFNSRLNAEIDEKEKDFEDGTQKDAAKEKKSLNNDRLSPEMKRLLQKIQELKSSVKTVRLNPVYVPNTKDHLYKHAPPKLQNSPFTSNISEQTVEKIMLINDVDDSWKLLLLMGIGVFSGGGCDGSLRNTTTTHIPVSAKYTEVMKALAQEQKLYLIIASTDYIYGTNYQFCHGYISKDLQDMSQEKCIQAMGRVGRNKLQHDYSVRFRDNELLLRLFHQDDNKPECMNMRRLFTRN